MVLPGTDDSDKPQVHCCLEERPLTAQGDSGCGGNGSKQGENVSQAGNTRVIPKE